MADPSIGMDKGDLKLMLAKSKKEPVNCAVAGNSADASSAFILLHKVKAPKAISLQLDKENPKNFNMRWGTAEVDMDDDPKLVIFRLHKGVTGMAKKLKKSLKGTGYTKVRLEFDDGTPSDADIVDEDGAAAPAAGEATPQPTATASGAAAASAPPAAPGEASAPQPTAPGAGAEAPETATQEAAQESTGASTEAAGPADPVAAAALAKAGQIWVATRTKVHSEVDRLKAEISKVYADSPELSRIEQAYAAKVQPVLAAYDIRLTQKLEEAVKATDATSQAAASAAARVILGEYATFTAGDALLKDLDANPFAPLAIQTTVMTTLKALGASVR